MVDDEGAAGTTIELVLEKMLTMLEMSSEMGKRAFLGTDTQTVYHRWQRGCPQSGRTANEEVNGLNLSI